MPFDGPRIITILVEATWHTDGAFISLGLAYLALRKWRNYNSTTSALHQIRQTPETPISDLRSLLLDDSTQGKLVFVRGVVAAKPAAHSSSWKTDVIVAPKSGEIALVVERTQKCFMSKMEVWEKEHLDWLWDSKYFMSKFQKGEISTRRTVPFVLVERDRWPCLNYVDVSLDDSNHPLPLTTVYYKMLPVHLSPWRKLLFFRGQHYTTGILDEEKILPPAKEIYAIGLCSLEGGIVQIKSYQRLPYFLSDMTKDEMEIDLAYNAKVLYRSTLILGLLSLGILGYAVLRNWRRWKKWRARIRGSAVGNLSSEESQDLSLGS